MKTTFFKELVPILLILLFSYTATSKFLDFHKFVFQMSLAPVPLMKTFAPILGWVVPTLEFLIITTLAIGFFYPTIKKGGLYASVLLLIVFEIYIATMLLSGSHLPCTCGGIISTMGWTQHLWFNGFFIIAGTLSIIYSQIHKSSMPTIIGRDELKILSRA